MNELEEKLTKQITPRQLTLSDLGINYKKPTKEETQESTHGSSRYGWINQLDLFYFKEILSLN